MSIFGNMTSDATIANETDSVGSGGILESGLYQATITMVYGTVSAGGATGLVLQAKTAGGRDIKQTLWMSSGTAKGGNNFYTKDGEKHYLPGYLAANSLALLGCGKEISELDMEEKVVKVYSKDAKAEVPTKVQVPVELMGKDILIGLIKQTVDKTAKNESTGVYLPTGETREENEIDKFFRATDRMTTAEIRGGAEVAEFASRWEAKWSGNTKNKASKAAGTLGAPKASAPATSTKPKQSLFAAA